MANRRCVRGRAGAWLTRLLVATALMTPVAQANHFPQDPDCGNVSPFDNTCDDPVAVPLSPHPAPWVSVLGFVGRIEIRLDQVHRDDDDDDDEDEDDDEGEARDTGPRSGPGVLDDHRRTGTIRWHCHALGANEFTSCQLVEQSGRLIPFRPATLSCRASGHPLFLGLLPPLGLWGCGVDM